MLGATEAHYQRAMIDEQRTRITFRERDPEKPRLQGEAWRGVKMPELERRGRIEPNPRLRSRRARRVRGRVGRPSCDDRATPGRRARVDVHRREARQREGNERKERQPPEHDASYYFERVRARDLQGCSP